MASSVSAAGKASELSQKCTRLSATGDSALSGSDTTTPSGLVAAPTPSNSELLVSVPPLTEYKDEPGFDAFHCNESYDLSDEYFNRPIAGGVGLEEYDVDAWPVSVVDDHHSFVSASAQRKLPTSAALPDDLPETNHHLFICPQDLMLRHDLGALNRAQLARDHEVDANGSFTTSKLERSSLERHLFDNTRSTAASVQYTKNPITILKDWFTTHSSYPYPTAEEEQSLAQATGKSIVQIKTCLSNLRARMKLRGQPEQNHSSLRQSESQSALQCSIPAPIQYFDLCNNDDFLPEKNVCDPRLKSNTLQPAYIGPEIELNCMPVQGDRKLAISQDLAASQEDQARTIPRRKGKRQHASRFKGNSRGTRRQSVSDFQAESTKTQLTIYHCTVCPKAFKDVYGWRRHEAAVHEFHTTEWICMLDGFLVDGVHCAFCSELFPEPDHSDQHNIVTCLHKESTGRTFYRKDLLKQHILQIHLTDMEAAAKRAFKVPGAWAKTVDADRSDPLSLWCGFCQTAFESTAYRMNHVADHFRDGEDMDQWVPQRT